MVELEKGFLKRGKIVIRLHKYSSAAGITSSRGADKLIESGSVKVDGKRATLGMSVDETMVITVAGKQVGGPVKKIVLAFNKPRGIICTENPRERKNIIKFINYPKRITYAGRLDKDSEGLMIMTNDGDLIHYIMKSGNLHEKEYRVTLDQEITPEFIQAMENGVHIQDEEKNLDQITRKAKVTQVGKYTFDIVITQGLNRQIRRMCKALGYEVKKLKRTRIMNILLADLPVGKIRELKPEELEELYGREQKNEGASLPFK